MHIAHLREDSTAQTVDEHLESVAAWCALFAAKAGLEKAGALIGYLHDMGKLSDAFLDYLHYCAAHPGDFSRRGTIPHAIQGAKYLYEHAASSGVAAILALAIASHHRGLMDCVSPQGDLPFYARLSDPALSYDEIVRNYVLECPSHARIESLLEQARSEITTFWQRASDQNLQGGFFIHLLVRLLFSCLIDADRYDTYRFYAGLTDAIEAPPLPPWDELCTNLEKYLEGLNPSSPGDEPSRQNALSDLSPVLSQRERIDLLRRAASLRCQEAGQNPTGVYQLSVPTGGGKTLSSLRFALEHAKRYKKDRIIYIIPYMTIIDQNAQVIRKALRCDDMILEHHSNIIPDEQPDGEDYRLLTERWDSPIILTTMVQFLNTLFAGGTRGAWISPSSAPSALWRGWTALRKPPGAATATAKRIAAMYISSISGART
ncbi:MAG: CRISPR-associated endonuclease Cas3'' [Christensenellales bacterium]|jgi:CRISPR-associated endonuclease/helicase Cas3